MLPNVQCQLLIEVLYNNVNYKADDRYAFWCRPFKGLYGKVSPVTLLVCVNWNFFVLARVSLSSLETAHRVLSSPFLLQLEELKKEIAKEKQKIVNLKRELEEKRVNDIAALKESHRGDMAELERRLRGEHEGGIALLEQQYQVGAMIFMTHAAQALLSACQ